MNYQGIIFDLDGVICHTDNYHYKAWKQLTDRLGIYFDETINNRLRGVSRMESLKIVLERSFKSYTLEEKDAFAAEKNTIYCDLLQQLSSEEVDEDTRRFLQKVKDMGIKIAIGSSSKNAVLILKKLQLTHYFDAIADGNQIERSKPYPEVFLLAAEKLGLRPSQCIVVEDAVSGVDAAKAGGFTAIGIGDAKSYKMTDIGINNLSDIIKYLN